MKPEKNQNMIENPVVPADLAYKFEDNNRMSSSESIINSRLIRIIRNFKEASKDLLHGVPGDRILKYNIKNCRNNTVQVCTSRFDNRNTVPSVLDYSDRCN